LNNIPGLNLLSSGGHSGSQSARFAMSQWFKTMNVTYSVTVNTRVVLYTVPMFY
jgi:hypothetical protein